jgi:hypothetical protein
VETVTITSSSEESLKSATEKPENGSNFAEEKYRPDGGVDSAEKNKMKNSQTSDYSSPVKEKEDGSRLDEADNCASEQKLQTNGTIPVKDKFPVDSSGVLTEEGGSDLAGQNKDTITTPSARVTADMVASSQVCPVHLYIHT